MQNFLRISPTNDLQIALTGADYVIVSTPTNYDENTNFFDTSSVEAVIGQVVEFEPSACIVVKSTIPVGFIDKVRERHATDVVFFSPEFVREGKALHDNLYSSRIIVDHTSSEGFSYLLKGFTAEIRSEFTIKNFKESELLNKFEKNHWMKE